MASSDTTLAYGQLVQILSDESVRGTYALD